ncbi:MAG: tryptophan synthase subunit beta [Planctomycetes bacterium]|nr:tryptophan synthase subunit beta [Planctomycetota bacterium]
MSATLAKPGRFGAFGGRYVPETLMANLIELDAAFEAACKDPSFKTELASTLADFVGRPTPLYFAERLSREWGGRVFLKREDLTHTGAHKINNAAGQALLAKRMGKRRIVAETGAGQHGVATAAACARLGLSCRVYMGALDCERQQPNVARMKLLGAEVFPCEGGTRNLKVAINEAIRDWVAHPNETYYLLGSAVGPHPYPTIVRELQSVIGIEAREQFTRRENKLPDAVIACVGGGSNAIGIFAPFLEDKVALFGVEAGGDSPEHGSCTLAHGRPGVLHGAFSYVLQDGEGQITGTHSVAPGLDYPGVGPQHSALKDSGRVKYEIETDETALAAFHELSRIEGILPALESSHALAFAKHFLRENKGKTVIVNLSGRGDKDLPSIMARSTGLPARDGGRDAQ